MDLALVLPQLLLPLNLICFFVKVDRYGNYHIPIVQSMKNTFTNWKNKAMKDLCFEYKNIFYEVAK